MGRIYFSYRHQLPVWLFSGDTVALTPEKLYVYYDNRLIVVETSSDWAIQYWTKRKLIDKKIKLKQATGGTP